jgi:membrane-associated progesterone receptor component
MPAIPREASDESFSLNISSLGKEFSVRGKITLSEVMNEMVSTIINKLKSGDILTWSISLVTITVTTIVMYSLLSSSPPPPPVKSTKEEEEPIVLRDYTLEQLLEFNGVGEKSIYVAMKGDVFDVSKARNMYGPEGGYHCFAGRESSRAMAKMSFEESELSNPDYSDLSPFEKSTLADWYEKFRYYKGYPIVGKVSVPPKDLSLTRQELLQYKGLGDVPSGRIDAPIYLSVSGDIFDVSYGGKEMYGLENAYHIFAGIDASCALAKMSFKPEDLINTDLASLTDAEKKVLQDWYNKFAKTKKYPIVGKLI